MFIKNKLILLALFVLTIQFLPKSAQAVSITFTDFQAVMTSSIDPFSGNETISLLVDSSLFGTGGIAGGMAAVGQAPPDDSLWLVDPFLGVPPDDSIPAISFLLNPAREVMGIDPEPFRIFLTTPPDDGRPGALIGMLDFSSVTGFRGSLNLSGVQVLAVDATGELTGDIYDVDPFTIQSVPVPEPSTFMLFGIGLAGIALVRNKTKRVA